MLRITTKDPDEFLDAIKPVAPVSAVGGLRQAAFDADANAVRLPRVGLFSVAMENSRVQAEEPCGFVGVTVPLDMPFEIARSGGPKSFAPGSAHVLNASRGFDLRTSDRTHMLVVNLLPPLLKSQAGKLNGLEGHGELHLPEQLSLLTPAGRSFWNLVSFLWRETSNGGGIMTSPLVTAELEGALLAALMFAGDEQSRSSLTGTEIACLPAHVARAEEFIAANLTEPVTLADVAAIAGVSVRTLNRAFHRQTSARPTTHLQAPPSPTATS